MTMVSVIIPCRNEAAHVTACVESIINQDYPHISMEVLFVDGMSTDGTRQRLAEYCAQYDFLHIIDNPKLIVPTALNIGISQAAGDVIIRLDMHTVYAPNYISVLVDNLFKLEADNVGCVCKTDVKLRTPKSVAIKAVLSSRFGVGNSAFRIGVNEVQQVDTVPFGCYRRNVFVRYGLFDERLVRNQDIEFNSRIVRGGGRMFLLPDELCTYYARATFRALAKNNYSNGLWNVKAVKLTHTFSTFSIRHFVPMIFVLSIVLPLLASFFYEQADIVAALSVLAYMLFVTIASIKLLKTGDKLKLRYLYAAFFVLHFSYGIGSIVGVFSIPKK